MTRRIARQQPIPHTNNRHRRRRRLIPHIHRPLRNRRIRHRHPHTGALATSRGRDRGRARLHSSHIPRTRHRSDRRVRRTPRHRPARRVRRIDGRRQLGRLALLQRQHAIGHTRTRNRDRRHRNIRRLASHGFKGGAGTGPTDGTTVVGDTRLVRARNLLAAAIIEDDLRVAGKVVRHIVVVAGLAACVGTGDRGHLHTRPLRVVGRTVNVNVGVDLAPF